VQTAKLARGAGYAAFTDRPDGDVTHAAVAAPYAHVTAPLRRLGDRYALEICASLCAGEEVPDWVLTGLTELPEILAQSGRRSHQYESAVLDLVEAGVLHGREGEAFAAVVVDVDDRDEKRGTVTVQEPAVEADVAGHEKLPLGGDVEVTLRTADVGSRTVEFALSES